MKKSRKAFTLAEVLITLGIIGVVAAMTIPALMNNVRATKLKSQFNKAHAEVQLAFKTMADNESVSPKDYSMYGSFYKVFMKYFKSPTDCGDYASGNGNMGKTLPCYSAYTGGKPYKTLDGASNVSGGWLDDGQIGLMDGALVLLENNAGRLWVSIDINGYNNPPNQWGIDLFTFDATDDGLVPMGSPHSTYNEPDTYCDPTSSQSMNGITCAEKATKDPNYFKDLYKNFRKLI